jgi:hypothetical protein
MARQFKPKTEATAIRGKSTGIPAFNPTAPTEDQIRQRAYELYLARGAAAGNEVGDWLQAEQELRAQRSHLRLAPTGS